MEIAILYLAVVSLISIMLTIYDKGVSRRRKARRISEKALFLWALLGGCAAMYATMLSIRHKTNHKRFMLGLPLLLLLQGGIVWWLCSRDVL